MQSIRITYIIGIIFPILLLTSCSPVPETIRDIEDTPLTGTEQIKKSQVEHRLHNMLKRDEFKHTIPSMIIMSADYGDTIFSYQSDLLVRPASNQKLLTAAAALQLLGPEYNFRTILYHDGEIDDGILYGNLIIKGFGDPLLSLSDLDKFIESLNIFGIRKVRGDVIIDDTFFDDVLWPTGWMWDDEPHAYVPYISALSINSNVVTLSVERSTGSDDQFTVQVSPYTSYIQFELHTEQNSNGQNDELQILPNRMSGDNQFFIKGDLQNVHLPRRFTVTVRDPAMFAGILFLEKLHENGITTGGTVVRGVTDSTAVPLMQFNTPIDSVLHAMNKSSDNLAAEATWKTLSAELYGPPGTGDGGRRAVEQGLKMLNVDRFPLRLADGSGVSFYNLVTTRMLAELLFQISENSNFFRPFYESLAVLGVDGTLLRRAVHSQARGRVRGKTGTLTGVSSLVGYVDTLHGERLIVAMLFQNFTLPAGRYRRIQDEICELLLHFNREASVLSTPLNRETNYFE